MIRRAVVAGALLLTFMVVVPVAAGAADNHSSAKGSAVKPLVVTGTGITKCPVDGKIKFTPPLFTTGSSGTETITISLAGKPCAGGVPVPHEYHLKATATITGIGVNTCSDFFTTAPPGTVTAAAAFAGTVTYVSGIAPSSISFPNLTSTDTLSTAAVKFSITPMAVTGSYPTAGGSIKMKSEASETEGVLNTSCGTTAGLKTITMNNQAGGAVL
jgi:hypothetical protein